jgi:hypothetical protein
MKLSILPVMVVGTTTAIGCASDIGWLSGSLTGAGVIGCAGPLRVLGSQSWQRGVSLERSVTISEKAHQVGGFGDLPKVSWKAM